MGAQQSTSTKDVFERFNRSHSGKINLDDMSTMASTHREDLEPGAGVILSIANSPLVLFHFDVTHEGAISYQEFEELRRNIIAVQKQIKEQRRASQPLMKRIFGICCAKEPAEKKTPKAPRSQHIRAYTTFTKSSRDNAVMARSSTTPVFTSFRPDQHDSGPPTMDGPDPEDMEGNGSLEAAPAPAPLEIGEDDDITAEVIQRIVEDSRLNFLAKLKNKEGREAYKNWLFKLTDVERRGIITLDELKLILRATERDGIRPQRLVFDLIDRAHPVRTVMDEYAAGRTFMTHDEFMTLAEIILQEYEFMQRFALRSHSVGKYRLTRLLGTGASGACMYAYDLQEGDAKAIKIIRRGRVRDMSRLDVEIKAMGMLQHPNVVNLEEVLQTEEHVFLVMENCGGGCLFDALPEDRVLSETEARHFFYPVIQAIRYCHAQGVCHRDLRLENILLDNQGTVKVSDFGHAGIFTAEWDVFSTSLVGSLYHISPEQIQNRAYSGQRLDMWAAGITLYRLLVGQLPFHSSNMTDFFTLVCSAQYELPSTLSPAAMDLVKRLLSVDPEHRPLPEDVLAHPWMNGDRETPSLLTVWEPLVPTEEVTVDDLWSRAIMCISSQHMVVAERPPDTPLSGQPPTRNETSDSIQFSLNPQRLRPLGEQSPPQTLSRNASMASGLFGMGGDSDTDPHAPSRTSSLISLGPTMHSASATAVIPAATPHPMRDSFQSAGVPAAAVKISLTVDAPLAAAATTAATVSAAPSKPTTSVQQLQVHFSDSAGQSPASTLPTPPLTSGATVAPTPAPASTRPISALSSALAVLQDSNFVQPIPSPPTPEVKVVATAEDTPDFSAVAVPNTFPMASGVLRKVETGSNADGADYATLHSDPISPKSHTPPGVSSPVPSPLRRPSLPDALSPEGADRRPAFSKPTIVAGPPLSPGRPRVQSSPPARTRAPEPVAPLALDGGSPQQPDAVPEQLKDARLSLPILKMAHCSDVPHQLKFIMRLRAASLEPLGNIWIELQHVSGEIWRFRRAGKRLATRMASHALDLIGSAFDLSSHGSDELSSLPSTASFAQLSRIPSSGLLSPSTLARSKLLSTDSLPMQAIRRFGRDSQGALVSQQMDAGAGVGS